jgi:tetratricopeptide (TPR) repeat protein
VNAPDVRYSLALADFMQGRYSQTLETLADPRVIQAVPAAFLLRARCLQNLRRPQEAIADCHALLARSPDHAEAHGVLGLLLQERGQKEAARRHVDAALKQHPKQPEAMLALAGLLHDSQHDDSAMLVYQILLAAHPECGRGWLGLAMIRLQCLQFDAARHDVERGSLYLPDKIGTWHALAWIELMRGDTAAAAAMFCEALALDSNCAEAHGGLAVVAVLQAREADARASVERSLHLDPHAMSPRYAEMLLLEREGRYQEAGDIVHAFLDQSIAGLALKFGDLVRTHIKSLRSSIGEPLRRPG